MVLPMVPLVHVYDSWHANTLKAMHSPPECRHWQSPQFRCMMTGCSHQRSLCLRMYAHSLVCGSHRKSAHNEMASTFLDVPLNRPPKWTIIPSIFFIGSTDTRFCFVGKPSVCGLTEYFQCRGGGREVSGWPVGVCRMLWVMI